MIGKFGRKWASALVFALAAPLLQAANGDLERVLQQMNAGAQKFQSAQADLEWLQFQAVVQDKDLQKGTIAFQRKGSQTIMAAHIREENGKPAPKDLLYKDSQFQLYQPMIKQVTVFSAGANKAQYESFLTLGFGGSGSDLQKNWDIAYQGTEQIDGVSVAKLELKPKQDAVRKMFTRVVVWIDPVRAISLRQQFFEPSGDTRTVTYSHIKYNTSVGKDVFDLKLAPGTKKITR